MLNIMRDKFKYLSWVLWLVVAVFVIYLIPNFDPSFGGNQGNNPTEAAKVGSGVVSMAEFQSQYQQLEQQFRELYGERFTPEVAKQMKLPIQALDRAIGHRILIQEAEERGLTVSDDELRRTVLNIPGLKDESGAWIGEERYRQVLAANGRSVRDFEKSLRDDLSVQKLTSSLQAATSITDAELERRYRAQTESASIRYVLLPAGRYTGQVNSTPEEQRSYFDAHRAEFRLSEQRVIDYLLVETSRVASTIQVPDADLQAFYEQRKSDYTRPEQVRARHILVRAEEGADASAAQAAIARAKARIEGGEDFAKVAAEVSQDPSNKDQGGDLGYFGRGAMVKEFENAAFGAPIGGLVGPLRTSFGVHLIKVEDKREGGVTPFEQVKPQILSRLQNERAQTAAEEKAKALQATLAKAAAGEKELRAAADASEGAATFTTTAAVSREDVISGIGRGGAFVESAFGAAVGVAQAPVRTPRGWAVLSVREVKPPRDPEFAEVEAKVKAVVEQQKMKERAKADLQRGVLAARGGESFDDIAKGYGVAPQEAPRLTPGGFVAGLGAVPELVTAALALEKGGIGGPIAVPQGAVIFEVTDRERFDSTQFAQQKDSLRSNFEREELSRLLGSLIERRRQELKVTYSRQILEQFDLLDEAEKAG
jgi:peptidyl-prolyl cis-trans isomerase D